MSERCSNRACAILLVFLVSIMSPFASADPVEDTENQAFEFIPVFADLDDFANVSRGLKAFSEGHRILRECPEGAGTLSEGPGTLSEGPGTPGAIK